MHDYTVTQLIDHRLAQFDAEADMSRLRHAAGARRRRVQRPAMARGLLAVAVARWIRKHIEWALARARAA
jgi:hypothetical protein